MHDKNLNWYYDIVDKNICLLLELDSTTTQRNEVVTIQQHGFTKQDFRFNNIKRIVAIGDACLLDAFIATEKLIQMHLTGFQDRIMYFEPYKDTATFLNIFEGYPVMSRKTGDAFIVTCSNISDTICLERNDAVCFVSLYELYMYYYLIGDSALRKEHTQLGLHKTT